MHCWWATMSSEAQAAWAQAVLTFLAMLISVGVVRYQIAHQQKENAKARKLEAAALASLLHGTLALVHADLRRVRHQLTSKFPDNDPMAAQQGIGYAVQIHGVDRVRRYVERSHVFDEDQAHLVNGVFATLETVNYQLSKFDSLNSKQRVVAMAHIKAILKKIDEEFPATINEIAGVNPKLAETLRDLRQKIADAQSSAPNTSSS